MKNFTATIDWTISAYDATGRWIGEHPKTTLVLAVAAIVTAIVVF
jgi:hypothetical protein